MSTLEIPRHIFEQMLTEATEALPIEACGILAGRGRTVTEFYKMTNTAGSAVRFMMAPEEQFAVARDVRNKGLEMLAIYHSHPAAGARPSAEDIRLALTPDVIHVILSLVDADNHVLKGFVFEDGSVTEAPVDIVKD